MFWLLAGDGSLLAFSPSLARFLTVLVLAASVIVLLYHGASDLISSSLFISEEREQCGDLD